METRGTTLVPTNKEHLAKREPSGIEDDSRELGHGNRRHEGFMQADP